VLRKLTAIMSPVVSVIVTSITRTMLSIEIKSKLGQPYLKGVVVPSQAAWLTGEKLVWPRGIVIRVPMIKPSRTAIFPRKP
jgi:hypothetical protein